MCIVLKGNGITFSPVLKFQESRDHFAKADTAYCEKGVHVFPYFFKNTAGYHNLRTPGPRPQ